MTSKEIYVWDAPWVTNKVDPHEFPAAGIESENANERAWELNLNQLESAETWEMLVSDHNLWALWDGEREKVYKAWLAVREEEA